MSAARSGLARSFVVIQGPRARFAPHLPLATFWSRLRRFYTRPHRWCSTHEQSPRSKYTAFTHVRRKCCL